MRGRDPDQLRHAEADIVDSSEMLEHAAYIAMASMLVGPLFDADARDPGGRIFRWIDRMLASRDAPGSNLGPAYPEATWGPTKDHTARTALRNVLYSAPELASVFVDRCYSPTPRVAGAYFWVLAEVYSTKPLPLEPFVVVALVLHKVVDAVPSVRDAARGMLGTLARRQWSQDSQDSQDFNHVGGGRGSTTAGSLMENSNSGRGRRSSLEGGIGSNQTPKTTFEDGGESSDGAVVVGSLPESHQAYQQHLSAMLARDHAELSYGVTMEVLSRHQGAAPGGVEALLCLPPWLEYASFGGGQWDTQWGGAALRALYSVTVAPGSSRALAAQKLWATVASNRRNIVPTLDFLIRQGMAESAMTTTSSQVAPPGDGRGGGQPVVMSSCAVGKQIALYLSRVAPRQTIDHLTREAAQQMVEQDEAVSQHARARRASSLSPGGLYTPGGGGGGGGAMSTSGLTLGDLSMVCPWWLCVCGADVVFNTVFVF